MNWGVIILTTWLVIISYSGLNNFKVYESKVEYTNSDFILGM